MFSRSVLRPVALACVLVVPCISVQASWLSDITGVNVDVPNGTVSVSPPRPERLGEALSHLPNDIFVALVPGAMALASEIRRARGAIRPTASPIPDPIRRELLRYFAAPVLDRVRFAFYDPNRFSLDTLVLSIRFEQFRQSKAITLDDVIVFRGGDLSGSVPLWAHEVLHTVQYANVGVESFAAIYVTRNGDIENPGYELQSKVEEEMRQVESQRLLTIDLAFREVERLRRQKECSEYQNGVARGTVPPVTSGHDPCGHCVTEATVEQIAKDLNGCNDKRTSPSLTWNLQDRLAKWADNVTNPGLPFSTVAAAVRQEALERASLAQAVGKTSDVTTMTSLANRFAPANLETTLQQFRTDFAKTKTLTNTLKSMQKLETSNLKVLQSVKQ
jgi:hypothetical protein